MKILHLFSSKVFAGLERHIEELSFEQSKNHEVVVIGPERFKHKFRADYTTINTNQWRYSPLLWLELRDAMARINPEVVHTHGQKMTNFIKADLHFSTIHGTKKNVAAFKKTQFIFGASKTSLEQIPQQKSMVLENWVDESRFYNFDKGSPQRYIYVGRLEPVKNPLRLLKAWKNINHKLDIYGDGSLKSKIIDFIKQNTLTDRVRLMGEEDDVKNTVSYTHLTLPTNREV